jgi:alpha-amylase
MWTRTARTTWIAALVAVALAGASCTSSAGRDAGAWQPGQALTLAVAGTFPPGTVLRDHYTGKTATVATNGNVTVEPDAAGVVLLERDGSAPSPFRWKNATVYFVITDRFANGDPTNDGAYGREPDGADEVGTWHGGDLAGLTASLDHVESLGATAIWITSPVEQVHGWVSGGSGDFKHYGYHGYWARDFTRLDAGLGTPADLQGLVGAAHQRGIRVLLDVVMNHPGYATGDDLVACLPQVFWDGTGNAFTASYGGSAPPPGKTWASWNELVNYGSPSWPGWWGVDWVRAGLGGGYQTGGTTDLTRSLNFLPDFKTESTAAVPAPPLFGVGCTPDTAVVEQLGFTVREYLVSWHTDWVRQYGVDGFRCDTAKNVELPSWKALKDAAIAALSDWKAANPGEAMDDAPFWMTGEAFGHGPVKDGYYTDGGFDSLLNFSFQPSLASLLMTRPSLAEAGVSDLDPIYAGIAALTSTDATFDVLSYVSSHDTALFYASVNHDARKQREGGTALLLAPGGVQVFYGDESGRRLGPSASDPLQGTRSDMNWGTLDAGLLAHWRKLGTFRKRHAAVGAGTHERLASPERTYAFARRLADGTVDDAVVVILTPPG